MRKLFVFITLFGCIICQAQTNPGRRIHFQGKIYSVGVAVHDPSGTNSTFEFFIGAVSWGQVMTKVPVNNGLYAVVLGTKSNPLPGNLFANADSVSMLVKYNGTKIDDVWLYAPFETDYTVPSNLKDGVSWGEVSNKPGLDTSVTNEIQALSLSGNTLSLSKGGGSVTLNSGGMPSGDLTVNGNLTVMDTSLSYQFTVSASGMGNYQSNQNQGVWQSFTATANGRLRQIVMPLGVTSGSSVLVKIYPGEGITQAMGQKSISGITSSLVTRVLDLTTGMSAVALTGGNIYTIQILPGTGNASVTVYSSNGNPYKEGRAEMGVNDDIAFSIVTDNSYPSKLTFNNLGYMGVGTDNPTTQLEVNGRIKDKTGWVMPVGSIMAYGGEKPPDGWLICDGTNKSRMEFAELFKAIGTNYGYGDSISTFTLPDLRGRFLRGVDENAGNDPDKSNRFSIFKGGNVGNKIGSYQNDAMQGHLHEVNPNIVYAQGVQLQSGSSALGFNYQKNTGKPVDDGQNGTPKISSESRPKNVYINFIIKY